MIDKFKKMFINKRITQKKEVIICIHGFGRRLSHEYDNFLLWNHNSYQMVVFDIYHLENPEDCNAKTWIKRCEEKTEEYLLKGFQVSFVGFSMGGVIATHLAVKYQAKRLFLIAPAFDYIHVGSLVNIAYNKITKSNVKSEVPSKFYACFMEVVSLCKDAITNVDCPVCFIHGDKDETIPLRSSVNAYDKIPHDRKRLFIIHEGHHRMMLHSNTSWETFKLFDAFMSEQILPNKPIEYAPDIFDN